MTNAPTAQAPLELSGDPRLVQAALAPTRGGSPNFGASGAAAVQIHGMGGVGKTELATAYANDFAMAYPGGIYWLNLAGWTPSNPAREDEAQSAWLRALEQTLGIDTERVHYLTRDPEGKSLPPGAVRERLDKELGSDSHYLWILDNVPELAPLDVRARILELIRAPTANGRSLLTTRDGRVADGFAQERLDVLAEDDAIRLLARFRQQQAHAELEAIRQLVQEVGAHTQALILLGENARNNPGGYPRVLERLLETGKLDRIEQIADQLKTQLGSKARGIVATFKLSIDPLNPAAKELLSLASVCAPNLAIPDALIAAAFGGNAREDDFGTALAELLRASLLTRRSDKVGNVFIHPLVAAASGHVLQPDALAHRQRVADSLLSRISTARDIRTHAAIADDIQQTRELAPLLEGQRGVEMLLWLGNYEQIRGNFREAGALGARCLALAKRVLGEEDPNTLTAMSNLAVTLESQGNFGGARVLQEQVLPIRRRVFGEDHPDTLTAMNLLARTLQEQGDNSGARALQEQALRIRRRVLGEDHPDTLTATLELAGTLKAQGDLSGARALQEHVLSIRGRVFGKDHPETLTAMLELASILQAQGDYGGARVLQEQVLPISRRVLGDEHPDTLAAMLDLAATLQAQADLNAARALQELALSTYRRVLGDEHPDTLIAMNNLGLTLRAQGDLVGARALQEQALSIRRRVLGGEHPDTLSSMSNLGATLHALGDLSGARALQEQALSIRCRVLGREHPDTLTSMNNVAVTLQAQGDLGGARVLQEQVLSIRRRVLGEEDPDTTASAWNLFLSFCALKDLVSARALFDRDLLRLIDRDPATLGADQRKIREYVLELTKN